ncbi:recombinase family protein [Sphingomonas floccifaciens]|uniref:Recombinase family protein n=1 Tax=Sphingomonas floccifaciens TaxID=1844115 RepID=A0ABW4N9G3_9SPHN
MPRTKRLSARKVDFRSLTDGFDTATPSGRLLFHILASVAEMERELIKERTIAGLAAVRAKGGSGGGRKVAMTPDKIDTAHNYSRPATSRRRSQRFCKSVCRRFTGIVLAATDHSN